MNSIRALLVGGLTAILVHPLVAKLELAPAFTDHAVLQREVPVPVWGWDDQPGATITVTFGGQVKTTVVNQAGVWRLDLDAMPANATGADLVVAGSSTLTLHDLVVGEVWLAAGQSNMEWAVRSTRTYAEEQARPANPLIRHLYVEHVGADLPVGRVATRGWVAATPDTIGGFTAAGYYFARLVAEKLQVPVGIINSSWGGTAIESWIPEGTLRTMRAWPAAKAKYQEALKIYPETYAKQPALEAAWAKAWQENAATGKPVTLEWPRPPMGPGSGFSPSRLYNAMIAPFAPFALRGALWYQGESNVGRERDYAQMLAAMIQSWRAAWPLGDFPCLVVQLPSYTGWDKEAGVGWARMREAQASILHTPATGVAITLDGDEPENLHPTHKRPVGERLGLIALAQVYHDATVEWSGPELIAATREGAGYRVRFSHAAGLRTTQPAVGGFELAGADRKFHPAAARIDGTSVVVSSPAVPDPIALRYAFRNVPGATLANDAGLPAAPFRTDDW